MGLAVYLITAVALGTAHFLVRRRAVSHALVLVTAALQWAITIYGTVRMGSAQMQFFRFDGLALLMLWALALIGTAALIHSVRYTVQQDGNRATAQYYGAMQFLFAALTMAYTSVHVAMTWVFIEITTLAASALIFFRRHPGSIEATWKYVFACSVSLVFVYMGILLMSIAMGPLAEAGLSFAVLEQYAGTMDEFWLKMAFVFILVGYSAKMSLVPMFTAGIDAKDKAPAPAAALLSSALMNAGYVAFFRVYKVTQHSPAAQWSSHTLAVIALASLLVAAAYLVRVHNVKRLFAYSSVEHMAVGTLGLAAGGAGVLWGTLHVLIHSLVKSALFMHVSHLYRVFGTKELSGMGRYIRYTGAGTFALILGTLCVTALPPSGLFVTEIMVFKSLIDASWWIPLAAGALLLTVIVWGIWRDVAGILFAPPLDPANSLERKVNMPTAELAAQTALLFISVWLGFCTPQFVFDWLSF